MKGAVRRIASMKLSAEQAREFLDKNHRAFLITHRRDGGLQSSLVHAQTDAEGRAVVWARGSTVKLKNLRRDPRAALSVLADAGTPPWMHIEGEAQVIGQPDSMPLLEDYYRRRHGREHDNWDAYREQMLAEDRAIIRMTITRAAAG